jgi:hypothetical protein
MRQGRDDKDVQQFARFETEDNYQGEGGTVLAVLGDIRSCFQNGNFT